LKQSGNKFYADSLSLNEMREYFVSIGDKAFRAEQLFFWVYSAGVRSFEEMTNMSKPLREKLAEDMTFTTMELEKKQISQKDGCIKALFRLEDGEYVESVMLKDGDRYTGCISSQVGCRMGCTYCSTAKMGLVRNLTAGEIVGQVRSLGELAGRKLTNLVFMGMGEPLDNLDNLMTALDILLSDKGMNFSHNKVTISTCGIADKIQRLYEMDTPVNIAISLNAYTDEKRSSLMPVNNKYNIKTLIDSLKALPIQKRKRITIEYILLKGINDSIKDAEGLVKLLNGLKVKVNLIGYNQGLDDAFQTSDIKDTLKFQQYLVDKYISTFVRKSLGDDIDGACGQLCVLTSEEEGKNG